MYVLNYEGEDEGSRFKEALRMMRRFLKYERYESREAQLRKSEQGVNILPSAIRHPHDLPRMSMCLYSTYKA